MFARASLVNKALSNIRCCFHYDRLSLSVNNEKSSALFVNSMYPYGLSVEWTRPEHFSSIQGPMQSWLLDTGSLTERLQSLCDKFEVKVLGQSNVALDKSESLVLPDSINKTWQIREVILSGDGQPWVFARSVLPEQMCRSTWADLGNQPLGQRIFNDSSFVRSGFEIGHLQQHPLTHRHFSKETGSSSNQRQHWARRSIFSRGQDSLLVAEAFLPDCPCYKDSQ